MAEEGKGKTLEELLMESDGETAAVAAPPVPVAAEADAAAEAVPPTAENLDEEKTAEEKPKAEKPAKKAPAKKKAAAPKAPKEPKEEPAEPAAPQVAAGPDEAKEAEAAEPEKAPDAKAEAEAPKPAPPKKEKPAPTAEDIAYKKAKQTEFREYVWKPWLWPIVTLVGICLVVSLLLGLTNGITAPIIAGNAAKAAEQARTALLPEADSFESVPVPDSAPNVTAIYKATNGTGYVIESFGRGYGGKVPAMTAFDTNGTIVGVTFMENSETPGLGKKLEEPAFGAQFAGLPAQTMNLSDIDALTSATISSGAAVNAVNAAVEVYTVQMGGSSRPTTPAEVNEFLLPGEALAPVTITAENAQPTAWRSDKGNYIIYGEYPTERNNTVAAVAMDENGTILNLWLDTSEHSEAYGQLLATNQSYLDSFIGKTAPVDVDVVAGTTGSSTSVNAAVNNALAALPAAKEAG